MNTATKKAAPLRAACYARFSTDMQRNESIDAQIRAIEKYSKDNNLILVNKYIDMAKSGKNDDRPEFLHMINDSKDKLFDVIVVHKLDRFARNRYDSVRYRHELKRHNVKLLSVLENYDSDTPEGVLMESLYEGMNEYYIKNLSREIMKGLNENAYKAKFNGGIPPLGFDVDENLNYVINPKEAKIIRTIFDMAESGIGYGKIIDHLKVHGYKTKRGSSFAKNSISSILRNPKYYGLYEFNRAPKRDVDGRRNFHANKPDNEIIRIDGSIPAIVSKEQFMTVQKQLEGRKHKGGANRAKEIYLLSGKLICGDCGMAYCGNRTFNNQKRKYVFYVCNNRQRKKECSNRIIRREYIEAVVLEKVSEYIFDNTQIDKIYNSYQEYLKSIDSESLQLKQEFEQKIKSIDKSLDRIAKAIMATDSETLYTKISSLEAEKKQLEFSLAKTENESNINAVSKDELEKAFAYAKELFRKGKVKNIQKLIELFIDRVIIFKDSIEIRVKVKPDISSHSHTKDTNRAGFPNTDRRLDMSGAEGGT